MKQNKYHINDALCILYTNCIWVYIFERCREKKAGLTFLGINNPLRMTCSKARCLVLWPWLTLSQLIPWLISTCSSETLQKRWLAGTFDGRICYNCSCPMTRLTPCLTLSLTPCCFVVYSTRRFVVCLSVCHFVLVFFSPFSIAITSLGEKRANLSAFRTFVRFVLV